ncbi:hypothetical protein V2O64_13470 [Verrucomicrobiaceae bacterium 227]
MKPKKGVNLPVTAPQGSATGLGDMNLVLSALLSGILLLPAALHAEAPALPKFNPTPVSDGPILVFRQPKRSSNELALYLFDPATHEKPQVIWQNQYHPNPRPLKRLTTREILIEYQHQLQLVDLPTAVVTPLLEGTEQNKLVATEGKTIYFLKRLLPETIKDMGISLTTGKEDKTVVEKYFRPRDVLFRYEVGTESGAKKVSPIVIEHLLDVNDDGFFVITADKPQKLARIGRDGTLTEIGPFDSRWVAKMTTHAFSPKGDYLALAILTAEQDFHEERTLIVCDLKKNKVCFSDPNVPLGPNMFSGRSNFLDLTWRTDEILQYCGPFAHAWAEVGKKGIEIRFANVEKQVPLDKEAESKLPAISLEEEPELTKLGRFELKFREVYYPGEKIPIASGLDEEGVGVRDLDVDSKGQWAAYSERKDDQVYLIDGKNRTKKAIHSGWAHDFEWLEVVIRK